MPADAAVVRLAGRQHGVVTIAQLLGLGLSRHAVTHRIQSGWLRRVHRGVYLVGPLTGAHTGAMAATLAAGDGALLSHRSAAVLWELQASQPGPLDVLVPGRKARHRPGLRLHRDAIHPADATTRHGIPLTSPARTLLDLAIQLTPSQLARATEHAQIHHAVTDSSLSEQFSRYPRHRGTAALREAMQPEPSLTRSEAERRLLDLIRKAGLPPPETNVRLHGHEVDFLWRAQRLVVEVDGYAYHQTRAAFERDRRRDADLQEAGFRVLRPTWRRIADEGEQLLVTLTRCLS
jgi:very-short-patch-repair endonuclease